MGQKQRQTQNPSGKIGQFSPEMHGGEEAVIGSKVSSPLETEILVVITSDRFVGSFSVEDLPWSSQLPVEGYAVGVVIDSAFPIADLRIAFLVPCRGDPRQNWMLFQSSPTGGQLWCKFAFLSSVFTFLSQSRAWDVVLNKNSVSAFSVYWTGEFI